MNPLTPDEFEKHMKAAGWELYYFRRGTRLQPETVEFLRMYFDMHEELPAVYQGKRVEAERE